VAAVPAAAEAKLDRSFHALADPSRRAMIVRLTKGPASVSELARPLAMSLPAVVQHIDVLQDAGLIRSEKVGRVRTCRLEVQQLRSAERWIADHRAAL
jgi:DNA-binding transcriptional ArsR family regulator